MKTTMKIKWGRLIGSALITVALIMGIGWVLFHAVLQESFKNYPPTAEELAEDPSLAVYTEGQGN